MGMFKSKSDLSAGPDVPMDQVRAMKAQGYSNTQIIQTLQRDGYASSQIFDAISQAEMMPSGGMNMQPMQSQDMPPMPVSMPEPMPQSMQQPMQQQMQQPMHMAQPSYSTASNEELIEAIINEKWNELIKDINKVIEWKQKADIKLSTMEQQMKDLRDQFDKLHQALIGKIGDYDKNMLEVATELQAMEKVFSKVLPSFMDNVNELGRITDNIKGNKDRDNSMNNSRDTNVSNAPKKKQRIMDEE